ncbi:SPOR domain-containing protein [Hydrogenophaga pseudoflava]|uniref:SPOR domain-containing protein n=1 Tax=Hydrogenophaga pseudoflava TaxID=47421 RepID=UPI0027E404F8|nr:SPOR domain-containing protein [Hydrogenophaga pseudoflava]MDQ7745393.1 SPOR domain-containing protein [Hydrogenophaga pseudoflava]
MLTSRSGSAGHPASTPPQSIEAVRRRARHRLIGAAVLVLVGVLGFPLLFDTQPRPIAVDVPIEIPSRNTPAAPAPKSEPAVTRPAPVATAPVTTADSLAAREEVIEPKVEAKPADKPVEKPSDKPSGEKPPAEKPSADKALAEKATEKPAEKPSDKATTGNERIVVQVGAFSEVERAREARLKLERAGLKTYTHVAETPQGRRIRVRLGPFATRAEAEKAAERAKALGLSTALLWL